METEYTNIGVAVTPDNVGTVLTKTGLAVHT